MLGPVVRACELVLQAACAAHRVARAAQLLLDLEELLAAEEPEPETDPVRPEDLRRRADELRAAAAKRGGNT